jgi:3-isopropylmalate/(R)-2-methylmalate dehydratase small subunit
MTPFTNVSGAAIPLMLDNIDTDVIIRINRLTTLSRDEMGPYAFEALRFLPDGTEDNRCVLNQPQFSRAPFLIAGRNFGCGSSREGAVWALAGRGVRCVIAESFGDIFFNNCFQNGVLPIKLSRDRLTELIAQIRDGKEITVNLEDCYLTFPHGHNEPFHVEPMKRLSLLSGMDDITRTLSKRSAIEAWQEEDKLNRPWVWS